MPRRLSFVVSPTANLSSAGGHPSPYQVQNWLRRRLEDTVEDVFRSALQRGDLAAAEDLLHVIENMQARGHARYRAQRRGTAQMIERCRRELEARKIRRRLGTG